jgi:hypothetical protein
MTSNGAFDPAEEDVRKQRIEKQIRMAVSSARIEGLEVTDATTSLMRDHAESKITSEEAIKTIVNAYAPRG